MSNNQTIENVGRRRFLQLTGLSAGGLILGTALPGGGSAWASTAGKAGPLNLFVTVHSDDTVSIVCHRSEMGQGIRTALPQIVADELEADWHRVNVVQGLGDERYGSQNTDGSRSIRRFYDTMRTMGASARTMLEQAAAQQWKVPADECSAKNHAVVHTPSGRRLRFGELAAAAAAMPVPDAQSLRLKDSRQFNYIGKPVATVDAPDMVTGRAQFGQDVTFDNLLIASIERAPVLGSTIDKLDDSAARKVKGVVAIERLDGGAEPPAFKPLSGVAVLAHNTWTALKARKLLQISWSASSHDQHDSDSYLADLQRAVLEPGTTITNRGDVDTAESSASQSHQATYTVPYLAHATMEPPAATAQVSESGCEVWGCVQDPQSVQQQVAAALSMKPEQVTVNVTLLGGGFGRKSKPDFVVEAALLAKKMQRPVKVVWSREDDIRHDYYHAASVEHYRAGLDSDGHVDSWLQRAAFPSISGTFQAGIDHPSNSELGLGLTDLPYAIPNCRTETQRAEYHARIGWLRSVSNIQNAFGVCSFADELAHVSGQRPDSFLLQLIGPDRHVDPSQGDYKYSNYGEELDKFPLDTARLKNVLRRVAVKADLNLRGDHGKNSGEGWGIAVHRSFLSYVGIATKVQVQNGRMKIQEMHCVADVGLAVNPDRVRSQMEGAMIFGMSLALMGEIKMKNGAVSNSNFHDYQLLRMHQCPPLSVELVDSDAAPAGVGEPGVPPVAPSIANAVFAASGQRIRELPISKHLQVS
ncbi:xanthine dehydrogenase family protein molybdopterin-binding subunit [Microbulbifer hainanensis]|uniref:xanthine dehydrogenase family protein molybdopterin-binding subunit n=1 Tax=Microbulbifer hainanensis TaxID=2735675 RepID=UPI001865A8E3|nr:molybdopterin cofactor-binding domain-containing protein [Microbulbifer hainanensis]